MTLGFILDGVEALAIKALNAIITALGAALSAALSVLPDMPALPDPPSQLIMVEGWVAWVFPVTTMLDVLAFVLVIFLMWQLVAIALRWARAL